MKERRGREWREISRSRKGEWMTFEDWFQKTSWIV